ncbi:hypothetical protein [Bradyrhizobium tropiciagri]|uniref:hypothetical protein n=1 Tax=Bradyrhizobium tropiciagri TaxID=312253 RepID=UPI000A7C8CDE|nr:hypothetical protein [Bradyrhizobium tropiciagri]
MPMHIVYSFRSGSPRNGGKTGKNAGEIAVNGRSKGTRSGPAAARGMAPTHIPQSENICSEYDNNAGQEPKVGLSRAAQRIGFALWVIAYGAFARHPSPSVTGSH